MNEDYFPKRIVCLTEEPTETLYLLGEQERIVGISGFTVRPAQARKEKPKVSAFTFANIDKITALKPDLVIGFSDIQADIARALIAQGITVWINNHRSVEDIYKMMIQLGSMVGKSDNAITLVNQFRANMEKISTGNQNITIKPKVYFEEWYDPLITGIRWVSELIELAGGIDIFSERKDASLAKDRIIADNNEVVERNPDIIIASWCGKKFKKERLISRKNWNTINAVKNDFVFEIKSEIILQPGPAAISEGIEKISEIITRWHTFQEHKNYI
ncbi:MAG: cobalamin-binding protein [Chitinophagales bacterium]|nr:cobalamin-binding protein [Chitinophagales bacterium]